MKHEFAGLIPVREFDAELLGRDTLAFGGGTLLSNKIKQLKKVASISKIYVSTESKLLAELAREEGAIVLDRPLEYAGETAVFNDFVRFVASQIPEDQIVWTPVTAPLVNEADIAYAIDKYKQLSSVYDSLITVQPIKRYLLDENGPLNFRHDIAERCKEKLPKLYEYINAINIAPRKSMAEWGYNWGYQPYKLSLPPSKAIDICTYEDYQIARFLFSEENT